MRRLKIWDAIDDIESLIIDIRRELDAMGDELARMQLEWARRDGQFEAIVEHINRLLADSAETHKTGNHKDDVDDAEDFSLTIIVSPSDGRPD